MVQLIKKVVTGMVFTVAAFGLLTSAAFAHTNLSVSSNGSGSQNAIRFTTSSNSNIRQNNEMSVTNDVAVSSITGGNRTSGNTAGITSIRTGDTSSQVTITNQGNTNSVSMQDCMRMMNGMSMQGMMGGMSMNDMMSMMQGMENMPMDQMMQMCMQMDMCRNMSMDEMMAMCQKMGMNM